MPKHLDHRTDFFILGAAKCGTTALFEYLSRHPGVFMPPCKEPNFFCTDLRTFSNVATSEEYDALFAPSPPHALRGEASAMYLFSRVAISRIIAHNPAAKVIVMLRNPIEAARSFHAAAWGHGHEDVADFEEAWRLQDERRAGRRLPPRWPDPETLQYGLLYRYAPQVRRVLQHFPRRQCLFLIYEEFFAAPGAHLRLVVEFLGLAPRAAQDSFSVVNPTVRPRSALLARLMRRPPGWLRVAAAPLRRIAHALGLHPLRALLRVNMVTGGKSPMREAFRAELVGYFADDVVELEQLLGRQLWPMSQPTA
jgi:hypothetical protein